jgi:predicted site-specific integrase-resolvase
MPQAPLLTLREAARLLSVAVRTLQAWRAVGRLRVVALSARCIRVEPAEVARLISESRT